LSAPTTREGIREQLLLVTSVCPHKKGGNKELLLVTFVCPHKKEVRASWPLLIQMFLKHALPLCAPTRRKGNKEQLLLVTFACPHNKEG